MVQPSSGKKNAKTKRPCVSARLITVVNLGYLIDQISFHIAIPPQITKSALSVPNAIPTIFYFSFLLV